jgi:hypothetical protein
MKLHPILDLSLAVLLAAFPLFRAFSHQHISIASLNAHNLLQKERLMAKPPQQSQEMSLTINLARVLGILTSLPLFSSVASADIGKFRYVARPSLYDTYEIHDL